MTKVMTIYEAKTHLSKLGKRAKAGETIYVGAYGKPEFVIAPAPAKKPIKIGMFAHKRKPNAYKYDDLVKPDMELAKQMEDGPLFPH